MDPLLSGLSLGGLDGGAGGISPDFSSRAMGGTASADGGHINVGGFNPPALQGNNSLIIGAVLLGALWLKYK